MVWRARCAAASAESGREAAESDQDQEAPADLVDDAGEGSETNRATADPGQREVALNEVTLPSTPTGFALYLAAGEPLIDPNAQIDEIEERDAQELQNRIILVILNNSCISRGSCVTLVELSWNSRETLVEFSCRNCVCS